LLNGWKRSMDWMRFRGFIMLYNIHVVFDTLLRTKEGILSSDKEIKRPGDEALNFIGKDKKEKIKALKIKANIIEKKIC